MIPTSFFCFKRYNSFRLKTKFFNDYKNILVKIDSINYYGNNMGPRDGNVINIFYSYEGIPLSIELDEDVDNDGYLKFLEGDKDSTYVLHNDNAQDIFAKNHLEIPDIRQIKKRMYFNLSLVVFTFLLLLWFIYIIFIEDDKKGEYEEK